MSTKILVVEDEKELLLTLKNKLETDGYTVISSMSGADALIKVQTENPDLVLLDILIIGKNGLEFLHDLREKLKSTIPVIVSSNLYEQEYIDQAKSYDIAGYIVKSDTSLNEISNKIHQILTPAA